MILFLDFDGVLHPQFPRKDRSEAENKPFAYVPRLEGVLRDFPHVDIVISSSWRTFSSLAQIQARFSPDIAQRIIGVIPTLKQTEFGVAYAERVRNREVRAWIEAHGRNDEPWVALDDDPWNFLPTDPLVLCEDGFFDAEEATLRAVLLGSSS